MDNITLFLQNHQELLFIVVGMICLVGAIRDWRWLYSGQGTRWNQSILGPEARRLLIGCCGALLIVIGIWILLL